MRGLAPHDASSSRASAQAPAAHGSVNSKGLAAGKLGLASPTFIGLGNASIADDVFFALKDATLGSPGWVLVLAVSVSALATCQTTILPTARGIFAMGVYKAVPERFARTNPTFHVPEPATWTMGTAVKVPETEECRMR